MPFFVSGRIPESFCSMFCINIAHNPSTFAENVMKVQKWKHVFFFIKTNFIGEWKNALRPDRITSRMYGETVSGASQDSFVSNYNELTITWYWTFSVLYSFPPITMGISSICSECLGITVKIYKYINIYIQARTLSLSLWTIQKNQHSTFVIGFNLQRYFVTKILQLIF